MYTTRFSRILTPVLAVCLVSLFVIAAPLFHAGASSAHSNTTSNAALPTISTNLFTQFPWSNVSRDSSKYVLQISRPTSAGPLYTLEYGSLSGGSPFVFASITNVQLATVGWTTM